MASRHTSNRRRSYGRRVHELHERMHEERRYSRDDLRNASTTDQAIAHAGASRDRGDVG
jgi:hypothetical protein